MKKTLIILTLAILLTGCSKDKKLNCTKTIDDEESSIEYQNEIKFDDSKVSTVSNKMTLTFKKNIKDNMSSFEEYGNSATEQYNKQEGINAKLDKTGNSIILTVDYNISKMDENNINNNNFNYDYDKLKEEYVSLGYICK